MNVITSQWSGVRKSVFCFVLCALLFALCVSAGAQQTGKVIGYLDPSTASGSAVLLDALRQEMRKLGWTEGKNITGLPSKELSDWLSLRWTWFALRSI
jgi:hypothetical protein